MSIVLVGSTSGSITLQEPAVAGTTVLDLPAVSGTILTTTSPKAGNVIQVVSTTKTDTFSSNSTSFTDITGLSASITPTSSSSKILVLATVAISGSNVQTQSTLRLVRGSTVIFAGDSAGSRQLGFYGTDPNTSNTSNITPQSISFLDSPATTSSTTYKIQMYSNSSSATFYINRAYDDPDQAYRTRTASSITILEIAA